jgi:hypothetical protein
MGLLTLYVEADTIDELRSKAVAALGGVIEGTDVAQYAVTTAAPDAPPPGNDGNVTEPPGNDGTADTAAGKRSRGRPRKDGTPAQPRTVATPATTAATAATPEAAPATAAAEVPAPAATAAEPAAPAVKLADVSAALQAWMNKQVGDGAEKLGRVKELLSAFKKVDGKPVTRIADLQERDYAAVMAKVSA